MSFVRDMREKVLSGEKISREEAIRLAGTDIDIEELAEAADRIREEYCSDRFDMCAVISVRGGRCSENCRFCPQASCSTSDIRTFPLLDPETILSDAKARNARHYCLVSSGRKMSREQIERLAEGVRMIRAETALIPCVSLGLLEPEDLELLRDAGVGRVHNNLETSETFFPKICTSHTWQQKREVIRAAHEAGLEVCSGGIIGVGESVEDRVDLAMAELDLGTESIPVNMLDPYPGSPLGETPVLSEEEVRRTVAVFRFILPDRWIRLAAGRDFLPDSGYRILRSGANATITGDMLNVKGITETQDLEEIRRLGYLL